MLACCGLHVDSESRADESLRGERSGLSSWSIGGATYRDEGYWRGQLGEGKFMSKFGKGSVRGSHPES